MPEKRSITDRLEQTPKHLITEDMSEDDWINIPTDEEMRKRVDDVTLPEKPKADPDKPDPRSEKRYTFYVEYTDARGKIWKGRFTNKILSIHERQQVGVMRSMLGAGQPIQSLDAMTFELNLMVAHLTYSLTDKPAWAENLRSLDDPKLLQEIYTEVDSHESFFLGWGAAASAGEEKSG